MLNIVAPQVLLMIRNSFIHGRREVQQKEEQKKTLRPFGAGF